MPAVSSSRWPPMGEPHLLARRAGNHTLTALRIPFSPELSTAGRRRLRPAFGSSLLPSDSSLSGRPLPGLPARTVRIWSDYSLSPQLRRGPKRGCLWRCRTAAGR